MRCKACNDTRLKPLHEKSEHCGKRPSAEGRLWPADEPRCDLTHVRHQIIKVSVSVTLSADQSTCWALCSLVLAKCGLCWRSATSEDHPSRAI